jgi:RimJ/RimL family protein N-acetyltransferase
VEFRDDTLRIRALEAADLEHMRGWINDPETSRFLSFSWPVSSGGQKGWFDRLGGASNKQKLFIETLDGHPIGVLSRVWATIIEPNEASLRLFEHVGFKRDGLLREDTWWEGRYVGTHVLSILSHEYPRPDPS